MSYVSMPSIEFKKNGRFTRRRQTFKLLRSGGRFQIFTKQFLSFKSISNSQKITIISNKNVLVLFRLNKNQLMSLLPCFFILAVYTVKQTTTDDHTRWPNWRKKISFLLVGSPSYRERNRNIIIIVVFFHPFLLWAFSICFQDHWARRNILCTIPRIGWKACTREILLINRAPPPFSTPSSPTHLT